MNTGLTIAVILAMIALGAFLIHRLYDQRADRIALYPYSRRLPGSTQRQSVIAAHGRRDHRDGGRGHLRPRRRSGKRARGRKA